MILFIADSFKKDTLIKNEISKKCYFYNWFVEKGHPLLKTKKIINATFNCIFVLKGHPYNKLKKLKKWHFLLILLKRSFL